jgi:hypothetical protein
MENDDVLINKTGTLKHWSSSDLQTGLSSWNLVRQGRKRDQQRAKRMRYLIDMDDLWWKGSKRERGAWQWLVRKHGVSRRTCTNIYIKFHFFLCFFWGFNEPVPLYQVENQILKHDLLSHAITAYMTQFYSIKSIFKAVLWSLTTTRKSTFIWGNYLIWGGW